MLRPPAVEAAELVVTAELTAACLVDRFGSQAAVVLYGRARHAARGHLGGLVMEMGNLPEVDMLLDLEWVWREMTGLPEERKRFEKPWEMKSPRATVHVVLAIQIHWRSP